jgi:hypothetical protein
MSETKRPCGKKRHGPTLFGRCNKNIFIVPLFVVLFLKVEKPATVNGVFANINWLKSKNVIYLGQHLSSSTQLGWHSE